MKQRFILLAAVMVLGICLVGCSSRNEPVNTDEPNSNNTHSVTPDTTPSVIPSDNLPNNDAAEGGGAGGTNDSGNGMFDDNNNGNHNGNNGNQTDNGTNRDDGALDDIGDAAGDVMDGIGDAVQEGGDAVGGAISPRK